MRKIGSAGRDPTQRVITATPRQLESLVRLSEAHARLHLRETVETSDVAEAVRLMKVATQSAATDPDTGTIDMDLITTGRSAASRTAIAQMGEALREKFATMGGQSLTFDEVRRMLSEDTGVDIGINELRDALPQIWRVQVEASQIDGQLRSHGDPCYRHRKVMPERLRRGPGDGAPAAHGLKRPRDPRTENDPSRARVAAPCCFSVCLQH